jgi:NADH dehydrogenase
MSGYEIRSVHRHPVPAEAAARVEWVPADVVRLTDWRPILEDVDVVLNLAWYRWGNASRFRHLCAGLERLVEAARSSGTTRFLQVSVPAAPDRMERSLPYLSYKRRLDRAIAESGLSYRIVRPTMLFGAGDRLLGNMLRLMYRYPLFPMFGDGAYHLSPVAASDLARILRQEATGTTTGTVDVGGPERYRYRELTDLMFSFLGKRPRYWHLSPRSSVAFAQLVQDLGSSLLYAYEVEWLLSDRLGPPAFPGLDPPMTRVEPFLRQEADRLRGRAGTTPARRG